MTLDFATVARAALVRADALVARWIPGGRREGDEYVVRNPKRADRRPGSFKINVRTGAWADFATNEFGGDLISLRAWLDNVSQAEAVKRLAEELGVRLNNGARVRTDETWEPVVPVPDNAPPPPATHPTFGTPTHIAEYRDSNGRLIGFVHRYEPPGERKQIIPLTLWSSGSKLAWRRQGFEKPRPLYGLDLLARRPNDPALVVEGEPKCDAGRRLVGDVVVVIAWPGGAKAVQHVDWSPLAGRKVAIWPDADEPGMEAAQWIAAELKRMGAEKIVIVDPPPNVAKGWDIADAEREGWTKEQVLDHLRQHKTAAAPNNEETQPFVILGHDHGRFMFWSRAASQIVELGVRELDRPTALMQLAPITYWERNYETRRDGFDTRAAANDLIQASYRVGMFDPSRLRGRGVWMDDNRVVVHLGDRLIVDGETIPIASFRSRYLYEQSLPLPLGDAEPLSSEEAARLIDACVAVSWENRDTMGRLMAGWLAIAPVCGALPWRPHVWLSSEAGGGKTWVLDNVIKPVLGAIALKVQSKSTEAGIRAALGLDARPVLFDEAETQNQRDRERMQQVLDLARQASAEDGADILKGTQTGGVKRYRIASCFAFASVNIALEQAADEGRAVVLTIIPPKDAIEREEQFASLRLAVRELITPNFGARFFARAVKLLPQTRYNVAMFSDALARNGVPRRTADTLGTITAGLWSLMNGRIVSMAEADALVAQWSWLGYALKEQQPEPEWRRLLTYLMQLPIALPRETGRADEVTVAEAIRALRGDEDLGRTRSEIESSLRRVGVLIVEDTIYFACGSSLIARACERTPWGSSWARTLARAPGAFRPAQVMWFTTAHRVVALPMALLGEPDAKP